MTLQDVLDLLHLDLKLWLSRDSGPWVEEKLGKLESLVLQAVYLMTTPNSSESRIWKEETDLLGKCLSV